MDQPEPIVEAAERQLRQGEPLTAYNTLQPALERWPDHLNQAIAILNTIREPDQNVDPADAAAWQRIIDSAIANA